MNRIFLFAALFLFCFLITCTTYDNAVVYQKNFHPGTNELLRFDGYYADTLGPKAPGNQLAEKMVKPIFFYKDGSVFSTNNYEDKSTLPSLVQHHLLKGSWGNYKIAGDTILLERFVHNDAEANYDRIILKGTLSPNSIHWTSRQDRNEFFKPVDYSCMFTPLTAKPDSTENWIRKKKKYNK